MEALVDRSAGLTSPEAADRHRSGLGNTMENRTSRSVSHIIRTNVVTRFNAIVGSLAAVVLVFGDWIDALFAVVAVLNSAIGIIQELRAKRSLDALKVLVDDDIDVYRDGYLVRLPPVGDEVRSGSHVVAGSGTARAIRVGSDSWARRLTSEARGFAVTRSERPARTSGWTRSAPVAFGLCRWRGGIRGWFQRTATWLLRR